MRKKWVLNLFLFFNISFCLPSEYFKIRKLNRSLIPKQYINNANNDVSEGKHSN